MKEHFPKSWLDQLETLGFDTFTEIQEQIFSPIYEGENVLGISPTGTGKTLAYLFPSLLKLKPRKAQQLLILAPNTELAGQIFDVTKQWAEPLGLQTQLFLSAPRDHQYIYMSATAKVDPDQLEENTIQITVDGVRLDNIQHFYMQVDQRDKVELLRKLAHVEDFRGLAFFNSLSDLGSAEEKLQYRGVEAVSLASDVNVKYRKVILERFKDHQLTLLLATDLVARGIDIDHLECVINYDLPRDKEIYTHRAGRTGRMGREGYVITLITHPEELITLKKYASIREIVLKNSQLYLND